MTMGQPDTTVVVLMIAAAGAYLLAFAALCLRLRRVGVGLSGLGWAVNVALLILNWVAGGQPPFGNMYHVMVFLSLCFLPLYLLLARREGLGWLHSWFVLAAVVPLTGALFMERDVLWRRVPALQSPWFVPHVVAYTISYALAAIAFALTAVEVAKREAARLRRSSPSTEGRRHAREYAEASYKTIRLAFPFMTFGLLSGALWAEEAWGAYWSWDPKETWSLITWTLYVIYFHFRATPRLRRHAWAPHVLAFLALLTTFLLVNLLPRLASALHSYT